MIVEEIGVDQIDSTDETFRISEDLDCARLVESLRAIGLQHPVVLVRGASQGFILVAGFRRFRAWKRLGHSMIPARVLDGDAHGRLPIFELSIWENLGHRELNALEKARVLQTLKTLCGVAQEELLAKYLPLLGLEAHQNVLHSFLRVHSAHPRLRTMFLLDQLTLATMERLAEVPSADQERLAGSLEKVRWSASRQRETLDLLEDLAAMSGSAPSAVLERPEIMELANNQTLSPFQRGERIYAALYRARNPRLARAETRFQEERMKLDLPGTVRITPSPFFETRKVRVEFECSDIGSLRRLSDALARAARAENAASIFQVE